MTMTAWWKTETADLPAPPLRIPAVAYYRHSAQDRQENSIPIQRDQVREWAEKNGVEIIKEFADHGKSGLNAEGRPAFNDMMENWVAKRDDFQYVLCLDVSRWGRFQDIDLSAQYSAMCKKHKKTVIYTTIGKPREDDPRMCNSNGSGRLNTARNSATRSGEAAFASWNRVIGRAANRPMLSTDFFLPSHLWLGRKVLDSIERSVWTWTCWSRLTKLLPGAFEI